MQDKLHLTLEPRKKPIAATLHLPGSKSIANRALLLAAVANGNSILHNVPDVADDVRLMINALKQLGINITSLGDHSYRIVGCNGIFPVTEATIFCGNSGTTLRSLTAMLSLLPGKYCLTGTARMKSRPIHDLVVSLKQLNADIDYLEQSGYPPIQTKHFYDNNTRVITCSGQDSSQYLTGLLMALSAICRETVVKIENKLTSKSYVDMTLAIIAKFGGKIIETDLFYEVKSSTPLQAIEYTIEPDASSASYFLACAALNGHVTVKHLTQHSLQGDKNFATVLEKMGAEVSYSDDAITVRAGNRLQSIDINMEDMPDAAMTLAVLCLFATGTSNISGIHTWKIKETDRLHAMYIELSKLGACVIISDDAITITPPDRIHHGVAIDTYDDHRMAMSFSLLAVYGIEVTINDHRCVEKTFSNYFDVFSEICY